MSKAKFVVIALACCLTPAEARPCSAVLNYFESWSVEGVAVPECLELEPEAEYVDDALDLRIVVTDTCPDGLELSFPECPGCAADGMDWRTDIPLSESRGETLTVPFEWSLGGERGQAEFDVEVVENVDNPCDGLYCAVVPGAPPPISSFMLLCGAWAWSRRRRS